MKRTSPHPSRCLTLLTALMVGFNCTGFVPLSRFEAPLDPMRVQLTDAEMMAIWGGCTWNPDAETGAQKHSNYTGNWNYDASWCPNEVIETNKIAIFNSAASNTDCYWNSTGVAPSDFKMAAGNSYAGTVYLETDLTVQRDLYLQTGTLDTQGYTITLTRWASQSVAGDWLGTSGGTFVHGNGKVVFNGSVAGENHTLNPSSGAFYDLEINNTAGADVILGGALDVDGTLTITSGTLDAATNNVNINVAGGVTIGASGVFSKGTGTLTFDGTTAATWTDSSTGGPQDLGAVTLNKTDTVAPGTNNKVTLGSSVKATSVTVDGTTGQADTLELASSGYTLTLTGSGTPLTVNGTLNEGTSSTVTYNSVSGATVTAETYNNLTVGDSATTATYTLGGDSTVSGVLTVANSSGTNTLDISSRTLTLSGSGTPLVLNGEGFTVTGSTVSYTSASGASVAATTYDNLTINGSGSFSAGGDIVVNQDLSTAGGTLAMGANNLTVGSAGSGLLYGPELFNTDTFNTDFTEVLKSEGSSGGFDYDSTNLDVKSPGNGSENNVAYVTSGVAQTSGKIQASIWFPAASDGGGNRPGVVALYDPTGGIGIAAFYRAGSQDYCAVAKIDNVGANTITELATASCTMTADTASKLRMDISSANVATVYLDGVLKITYDLSSDLTGTGSNWGLYHHNGSFAKEAHWDNVEIVNSTGSFTSGNIFGAGAITQSASGTTTLKGIGVLGGTQAVSCSGTNGSFQFYNLTVGDGTTAATTEACGNLSVSSVFTIAASHTFNANSRTITLSGSGTPFVVNGTFTRGTSVVQYTASAATTVAGATYYDLRVGASDSMSVTYTLGGDTTVERWLYVGGDSDTLAGSTHTLTLELSSFTPWQISGTSAFSPDTSTVVYAPANISAVVHGMTYYNLSLGTVSGSSTSSTLDGTVTVNNVLTLIDGTSSNNLDISSRWLFLNGSGTPLVVNDNSVTTTGSWVFYQASSGTTTIAPITYHTLTVGKTGGSGTFNAGGNLVLNGDLEVKPGSLQVGSYDLTVNGGDIAGAGAISQSASGTTTLKGTGVLGGTSFGSCSGTNGSFQFYNLTLGSGATQTTTACGNFTVSNDFTISTSATFNGGTSSYTHTLSGTDGLPFTITGTFTPNTNTIAYTGNNAAGNTTVTAATYNNLTLNNASETFDAGGTVTANGTITAQAGTFEVGANTVTGANVAVSGGTLSMTGSGGKLKISGSGTLSMTSGAITTGDVATPVEITTSDTATPTYVGVNLTGGTLTIPELDVDYLKNTGFVIGSGVSLSQLDNVRWGGAGSTYHGQTAGASDVMLDVTGQTQNLLNHTLNSWSGGDINVRSNTSGEITMWDWTGGFGGEENDSDNGGEVRWKGGVGDVRGNTGAGYPPIL